MVYQVNDVIKKATKVVCVGRNYAKHAHELGNEVPTSPLLFIKPSTSLCSLYEGHFIEKAGLEHEVELAILIKKSLTKVNADKVLSSIAGIGLAIDLTDRHLQSKLKEKGHPWERAKAFDKSCPISDFIPLNSLDLHNISFSMSVNDSVRQSGCTQNMLFSIVDLIVEISHSFTLLEGDIVLTGTPEGVGYLSSGDKLVLNLEDKLEVLTTA